MTLTLAKIIDRLDHVLHAVPDTSPVLRPLRAELATAMALGSEIRVPAPRAEEEDEPEWLLPEGIAMEQLGQEPPPHHSVKYFCTLIAKDNTQYGAVGATLESARLKARVCYAEMSLKRDEK